MRLAMRFGILLFFFVLNEQAESSGRSLRVGLAASQLISNPLPGLTGVAVGPWLSYDIGISPSVDIGIPLSYQINTTGMKQYNYGFLIRHFLTPFSETLRPFLEYGLLLMVSMLDGREGTGTSHDTQLGVGTEVRVADMFWFVAASYHISRLKYFAVESLELNYVSGAVGWIYRW